MLMLAVKFSAAADAELAEDSLRVSLDRLGADA